MLGAILLIILAGYGHLPESRRQAAGTAAAAGFALLFLVGHFLDDTLRLSGWPEAVGKREDLDKPHEDGGWEIALTWLALFIISLGALRCLVSDKGAKVRAAAAAFPKRPSWARWPSRD